MALHPRPRSVLILGGGEGATAREVLRHLTVENVTMVDIDGELIDFVREHWPWVAQGAFDDPRLDCVISDSREYLASTGDTFDVIIADMTAPTSGGPAERAYTIEAFELARARLAPGGLIVIQGDSAELGGRIHTLVSLIRTVRDVFGHAATCYASVPLLGGRYGFVLGCERPITLDPASIASTLHERGITNLRCVDEETLRGSFSVPRHIRDRLAQTDSIRASTDAKPSLTTDELYGATPAG
jgi:spermidine synthase